MFSSILTLNSHSILSITEKCCLLYGGSNIGSTIKSLKCRASQHNKMSSRTGLPIKSGNSSIMKHVNRSCKTNIDLSHFSVINKKEGEFNLRMLESMNLF